MEGAAGLTIRGPARRLRSHLTTRATGLPSNAAVDNAYTAALANGGADNGPPGPRRQFGERYYAANLLDPDRYSLEINFKPWLYDGPDPAFIRTQPTTK